MKNGKGRGEIFKQKRNEMLTRLTVEVTFQYIHKWNDRLVYLKLIQCSMSVLSLYEKRKMKKAEVLERMWPTVKTGK